MGFESYGLTGSLLLFMSMLLSTIDVESLMKSRQLQEGSVSSPYNKLEASLKMNASYCYEAKHVHCILQNTAYNFIINIKHKI